MTRCTIQIESEQSKAKQGKYDNKRVYYVVSISRLPIMEQMSQKYKQKRTKIEKRRKEAYRNVQKFQNNKHRRQKTPKTSLSTSLQGG